MVLGLCAASRDARPLPRAPSDDGIQRHVACNVYYTRSLGLITGTSCFLVIDGARLRYRKRIQHKGGRKPYFINHGVDAARPFARYFVNLQVQIGR